jgi:hypothetical protein
VEQAGRRSNQSASDKQQSCHESSKCHYEYGRIESPPQKQAHTHFPESTNHSREEEIGIGSKVKGNIINKQRSMDD